MEGNDGAVTNPMIDTASSTNWDGHAHRLPLTYSRARVAGSNSAIAGVRLLYAFWWVASWSPSQRYVIASVQRVWHWSVEPCRLNLRPRVGLNHQPFG